MDEMNAAVVVDEKCFCDRGVGRDLNVELRPLTTQRVVAKATTVNQSSASGTSL